jgi:mannose-6-phosphate isomerase-like protein (cupin superfamily)
MSSLEVFNLTRVAGQVEQPFALMQLALVGDLSVSLYICQGQLDWHKHFDEDELFLVHEGVIRLETELGEVTLYPDECAVVPKGVAHRSGSTLRSAVLLLRTAVLGERKNGHRRLHATASEPRLAKARLSRPPAEMPKDFEPVPIAQLENYELTLQQANGFGPRLTAPWGGALLLVLKGTALVEMAQGGARLEAADMMVVPAGTSYALSAPEASMVARLQVAE